MFYHTKMHYTDEDYRLLYNERPQSKRPSRVLGWIVAIFLAVLLGLAGSFDYASAIDADTAEKEARAASIQQAGMAFPLPWTATVEQRMYFHEEPKVRFYVPTKESK